MDIGAIQEHLELLRFDLARPLLVVKAPKGILSCDYINAETCNKADEVCVIVAGVNTFGDVHKTKVVTTSNRAVELGVQVGESDQDVLNKIW